MKVCFSGVTPYQLLLFLLITKGKVEEKYFIFPKSFPKNISDKISSKIIISEDFLSTKSKMLKGLLFIKYLIKIRISFKIGKLREIKKYEIYGDGFNIKLYAKILKVNLLEDGLKNYSIKKIEVSKVQKKLISFFWGIEEIEEVPREIEKIYLTGLASIPKNIINKVEIINLKKLWQNKTFDEQKEILNIFSFELNMEEKIKNKKIILFTQPLSEDGIISEEEKIEIYSKIIEKYPKKKLIIKTHPREKTNYEQLFSEYLVLNKPFPFEILNLLEIKFEKAITLFSTAALGLGKDVKVDFYGTEVNFKIFQKFGSCDNIMKRNCFL